MKRKGESAREGGAVAEMLLPLRWPEVVRVSSRLPFRRRGKRVKVRRLLLVRAEGAGGAVDDVGVVFAEASDTAARASRSNRNWGTSMSGPVMFGSPM